MGIPFNVDAINCKQGTGLIKAIRMSDMIIKDDNLKNLTVNILGIFQGLAVGVFRKI